MSKKTLREPASSDFTIEVKKDVFSIAGEKTGEISLGNFTFARRTRRDNYSISALYHKLTGGTEPDNTNFGFSAHAEAVVSVLLVDAPFNFIENLDLDNPAALDTTIEADIIAAFLALRQKEQQFRSDKNEANETSGQAI